MDRISNAGPLPTASLRDTLAILCQVLAPNIAKGVIIRRPHVVGVAERLSLDARAVQRMQSLSEKYGRGPLMLKVPMKSMAVVLDPADANDVLEHTPTPFSPNEQAKHSALSHFEPGFSLISEGEAREQRRALNERVLQSDCPHHDASEAFVQVVQEEVTALLEWVATRYDELDWPTFLLTWDRIVRRVVLGDAAADDRVLTEELTALRKAANWGFLRPKRQRLRKRFEQRLAYYLREAAPGSLMSALAQQCPGREQAPLQQVPQWLFAFEPAGMATFRALALLSAHPDFAAQALAKAQQGHPLDDFKATLLEALRLWPTTPLLLRQTTQPTQWQAGTMPANTSVLIHAPYFHRDERYLHAAHRFTPELWLTPEGHSHTQTPWPLVPFSGGPGICPGRHVVLLVTSHCLAALLGQARIILHPPEKLSAEAPMPGLLSPFHLRFRVHRRQATSEASR